MPEKKVKITGKEKFCPKCGSEEMMMVIGGQMGMWECKKCGYRGSVIPEREFYKTEEEKKRRARKE
jgi:ribosomal protein L37AE/L43A